MKERKEEKKETVDGWIEWVSKKLFSFSNDEGQVERKRKPTPEREGWEIEKKTFEIEVCLYNNHLRPFHFHNYQ